MVARERISSLGIAYKLVRYQEDGIPTMLNTSFFILLLIKNTKQLLKESMSYR